MNHTSDKESEAKKKAQLYAAELKATQHLLAQASKQSERIRIARNIHDLLGHHLTALIIKLQYAGHKASGETKTSVDECLHIARLLLSDVREAVSEMRDEKVMNLRDALTTLIDNTPSLNIKLVMDDDMASLDLAIAQGIVRSVQESITNTLRHSGSTKLTITIHNQGDQIQITLRDTGKANTDYTEGNGLKGIRERLAALGGEASFYASKEGFVTSLRLPLEMP